MQARLGLTTTARGRGLAGGRTHMDDELRTRQIRYAYTFDYDDICRIKFL
jgi:hypothetical protein